MENNLVPKLKFIAGRGSLLLQKHSPDILFGLGVVGLVGAGVMAAKASVKFNAVKQDRDEHIRDGMDTLDHDISLSEESTEYKQAVGRLYIAGSLKYVKLYAPSVSMGLASIAVLFAGHQKSKQRLTSAMAAYAVVDKAYGQYRDRVIDKYGEETDNDLRFGKSEKRSYSVVKEDGKKGKVKNRVWTLNGESSEYSAFFDEYSNQWRNEPALNKYFLKSQQAYFNDLLLTRGHVFLNEVWDGLGIPRTKAGAIVGWVINKEDWDGDGYIDFGVFTDLNSAFVNGYEASVLLDPNVDGVIYDLI